MEFKDRYDFGILVNEAERLVEEELGRRLEELADPTICVCADCVLDMAAFCPQFAQTRLSSIIIGDYVCPCHGWWCLYGRGKGRSR